MTNEELAAIILRHDKLAREWVFNFYCSQCARYLYTEDLTNKTCKKCKSSTAEAIGHAIPFITSATALEKLIAWVKDFQRGKPELARSLDIIRAEFQLWIISRSKTIEYHQAVVDGVGLLLEAST